MSSAVYALLMVAMLNGKAPTTTAHETSLAPLAKGPAGKVSLSLRMDERLDGPPRPQNISLGGEFHNGRFVRVERGWRDDNRLMVGVKRQF